MGIELVITTVDGKEVYHEEADNEINFTGHLADGSMIKSGIYFYYVDFQGIIKDDTGYFLINHYGGKTYTSGVGFGMTEVPEEPSPMMSILRCVLRDAGSATKKGHLDDFMVTSYRDRI